MLWMEEIQFLVIKSTIFITVAAEFGVSPDSMVRAVVFFPKSVHSRLEHIAEK